MPPTTRSKTASQASAPERQKLTAREAAQPKGIRKNSKSSRKEARQKLTITRLEAMAPLPWTVPQTTYLELQPPDESEIEEYNGYVARHRKKAKKNYNGSEVKISKEGYERLMNIYIEIEKRTEQGTGGIRFIGDVDGYAKMEVLEGQIGDYWKELKHAHPSEFKLFEIVEALSFFTDGAYDASWFNVDDGEGVEALMNLIGVMFVDCFRRLDEENRLFARLLSPPDISPFKNLGLVMGLAIGFADQWDGLVGEDGSAYWRKEVVKMAKTRGITLRDTKGLIEEKEGDGGESDDGNSTDEGNKDKFDFLTQVAAYKKMHGKLGGSYYVLRR